MLSIISSIIFPKTEIKERDKLKSEHSIKLGISHWKNRGEFMSEHAHKNTNKKRGKLMSEHAHNKCTGNWKKERVKVMFLSMLLKIDTRFFL